MKRVLPRSIHRFISIRFTAELLMLNSFLMALTTLETTAMERLLEFCNRPAELCCNLMRSRRDGWMV